MLRVLSQKGYAFDDLLLVPKKTTFASRFSGAIDLTTHLVSGVTLKFPIVSANMDTVTGATMASEMYRLGGLGITHRFLQPEQHRAELEKVKGPRIACVGLGEAGLERFRLLADISDGVLIDVAHGHSDYTLEQIGKLKQIKQVPVMAGNVATYEGAKDLVQAGADCIKVGVGPGSVCSTRLVAGCGVPQLTAIHEARRAVDEAQQNHSRKSPITLIADGGIRFSGDIVKALAAGADAVMIGGLFSGTEETPGKLSEKNNGLVKRYRGMASLEAQEVWKGEYSSVEGESKDVPYRGPVEKTFMRLIHGVLSGFSYQNAKTIKELQETATFIEVSHAGVIEGKPHGI